MPKEDAALRRDAKKAKRKYRVNGRTLLSLILPIIGKRAKDAIRDTKGNR